MRTSVVTFFAVALIVGCSSEDATDTPPIEDSQVADTATSDTAQPPADTAVTDGPVTDTPVGDAGTFACGDDRCGVDRFCLTQPTPGTCPPTDDAGADDADVALCPNGCPGCPPLESSCERIPGNCAAAVTCDCLVEDECGNTMSGTCEQKEGGYHVKCMGI
jgi:hypothetical protein